MQRFINRLVILSLSLFTLLGGTTGSASSQWGGYVEAEYWRFNTNSEPPGLEDDNAVFALEPYYHHVWKEGDVEFVFKPFYRKDNNDDERTYADIRELTLTYYSDAWRLSGGIGKVFWGVTEFVNFVDVINQFDVVDDPTREEKLGQPMLSLAIYRDTGLLEVILMPYFRERTFASGSGRFQPVPALDQDNPLYESSDKDKRLDSAVRYSDTWGAVDYGLTYFDGTDRNPRFVPVIQNTSVVGYRPFYPVVKHVSLDMQMTTDSTLFKLEVLRQESTASHHTLATGGFEHTLVGVFDSQVDVGVIGEFMYDERGDQAPHFYQNDIGIGLRVVTNDVSSQEWLIGAIIDRDHDTMLYQLEFSYRLREHYKLIVEGAVFSNVPVDDVLYGLRNDDYIRLSLRRYF